MSRDLDATLAADLAPESGPAKTEFLELRFGSGTVYLTTASQDLDWNGHSWQAVGGNLTWPGGLPETTDQKGSGVQFELSGVDQSVLSLLLDEDYLGRLCVISYAHLDPATGTVVGTPYPYFTGYMNDPWSAEESREEDPARAGTVTISTRLTSPLAALTQQTAVRCNEDSHNAMLRRAGVLTVGGTPDTFFTNVHQQAGTPIFWGQKAPS